MVDFMEALTYYEIDEILVQSEFQARPQQMIKTCHETQSKPRFSLIRKFYYESRESNRNRKTMLDINLFLQFLQEHKGIENFSSPNINLYFGNFLDVVKKLDNTDLEPLFIRTVYVKSRTLSKTKRIRSFNQQKICIPTCKQCHKSYDGSS